MSGQPREVESHVPAEPSDVTRLGKVHGGMVMKWIDQAGYAGAVGWSGQHCVTVALGRIQFVAPIPIGDLVWVRANDPRREFQHAFPGLCPGPRPENRSGASGDPMRHHFRRTGRRRRQAGRVAPFGRRPATATAVWPAAERLLDVPKAMEAEVAQFRPGLQA